MIIAEPSVDSVIDISRPIRPGLASWDDRFPPEVRWHSEHLPGQRTANSSWLLNSHTGTHVDAPYHHLPDGGRAGDLALGALVGPCRVAEISTGPVGHVEADQLADVGLQPGQRLLLKTRNSSRPDTETFDPGFCAVAPSGAERLLAAGIGLVGIDGPSIEPYDSTDRAVHRALLGAGVMIVEGLVLRHVEPGDYLLLCLPLPLAEAEAAPCRAVLMPR